MLKVQNTLRITEPQTKVSVAAQSKGNSEDGGCTSHTESKCLVGNEKLFLDLEGPETKTMSFKPENSLGITYGMESSLEKEIRYKTQADEMREK